MHNFEKRRDRYELFAGNENPLLNVGLDLALPDFRPYCKARRLPPFHFFLYCVLHSVRAHDNFMYRIFQDQVIRIDDFFGSYTVINQDGNLNYTRFAMADKLDTFLENSLASKRIAGGQHYLAQHRSRSGRTRGER